ncbi:MAG TPA: hypothetical protein VGG72_18540 [Bryobacteraceae bacterium]
MLSAVRGRFANIQTRERSVMNLVIVRENEEDLTPSPSISGGLFHKIFDEITREHPTIEKEHWITGSVGLEGLSNIAASITPGPSRWKMVPILTITSARLHRRTIG